MKRYERKPHTCPACLGTGEEQYDLIMPADDMTQVSFNEDLETNDCEYCGGEGIVYERLNVHEVADDFITDEYLMTLQYEQAV